LFFQIIIIFTSFEFIVIPAQAGIQTAVLKEVKMEKINITDFLEGWGVYNAQTFAAVVDLLRQIDNKKITCISDPETGLEIKF